MVSYEGKTVITLNVNNEDYTLAVLPSDLLLDVLREQLNLTGAKPGCRNGDCGTCTVVMDGWPVKSCLVLVVEAEGHAIITAEGIDESTGEQKAFVAENAFQCGYCTPGFLAVCHAMKLQYPQMPDEHETEHWLQSNICRCTSYQEIRRAVQAMYGQ